MSDLFLLDTSACIDILRNQVPAGRLPEVQQCCLSSIVTAELRTGAAKKPENRDRVRKLDEFIAMFVVRDFDENASRHYAEIRADLETRGISIGPLDLLIAAHARSLGASLLTANAGEFRRVRGLVLGHWR